MALGGRRREVSILLKAKDEASKVIDNIARGSLPALVKSIGATVAAYASFQQAANFIRGVVAAIAEADRTQAQLRQALVASGQEVERNSRALDRQADAFAQVSKSTDEQIRETQTLLLTLGGLTAEGLAPAVQASLDLAAVMKTDLRSAALLVAKAAQGQTETLSRYGIVLREGIEDSEKFAEVLRVITTKAAGQARAEVENLEGAFVQLGKAWNDLQEELGRGPLAGALTFVLKGARLQVRGLQEDLGERGLLGILRDLDFYSRGGGIAGLIFGIGATALSGRQAGIVSLLEAAAEKTHTLALGLEALQTAAGRAKGLAKVNKDLDELEKRLKKAAEEAKKAAAQRLQAGIETRVNEIEYLVRLAVEANRVRAVAIEVEEAVLAAALENRIAARAAAIEEQVRLEALKNKIREIAVVIEDEVLASVITLGDQIQADIEIAATNAVQDLSGALARAFVDGEKSFKEMAAEILRQMAIMIIQAIIFRAIMSTIGSYFGFSGGGVAGVGSSTAGYARGGVVTPIRAQHGMIAPGQGNRDTVPALLTPGEIVIPKDDSRRILGGRAAIVPAGGGVGRVTINFAPRITAMDGASVKRVLLASAREFTDAVIDLRSRGYGV